MNLQKTTIRFRSAAQAPLVLWAQAVLWRQGLPNRWLCCLLGTLTAVGALALAPTAVAQAPGGTLSRLSAAATGASALPGPGPLVAGEVTVSAFAERPAGSPGGSIRLGLLLEHAPGWHTYWRNPGDSGLPTEISWRLVDETGSPLAGQTGPVSLVASEIQWPTPSRMPVGPLASYGYEGSLFLTQTVSLPKDLTVGASVRLLASASWLVCKDVCIPGGAELSLRLAIEKAGTAATAAGTTDSLGTRDSLLASAERFSQADRRQPVVASVSPRYGLDTEGQRLVLEGTDPPEAVRDGYFFVEVEGLVVPAAAQALYQTDRGWRLEIPLSATANRAVRELAQAPTELRGVFRPAQYPDEPAVLWSLAPVASASALAARGRLVSEGETAAQAYARSGHGIYGIGGIGGGGEGNAGARGFLLALGLALIGGMLLNLMPCVFPVLGLKVLAFSQQAHSPTEAWRHGLVFTAGVVVSMLVLASVFLALRAAGEAVGWGFQLQNPWVVSLLALLFVVIALNLFGVFEIGLGLARAGGGMDSGGSAFGSGVLAVVVASPCTAPFMGSALGYTATASVPAALSVFASLGFGLALPYLILAVWPRALALLPRPGAWMETFRQALGFPMLATAAWLGWVLAEQNGPAAILALMLASISAAVLFWVYGAWQRRRMASAEGSQWGKLTVMACAAAASLALLWQATEASHGSGLATSSSMPSGSSLSSGSPSASVSGPAAVRPKGLAWEPGLPEQLAADGKVVFVDFTAAWCISCQANKARVIERGAVADRLSQPGHQLVIADWTRQDPRITRELNRHGRNGVPLYLVFGPGLSQPEILSEWLTESDVMAALDRAARRPASGSAS